MKHDNSFIRGIFLKYAGLSSFALLCSTLGQLGNSVVVGNMLGSEALSFVTLINPLYCIFTIGGYLLSIGGLAVCSFLIGEDKFSQCGKAYTVTYILTVMTGVIVSGLMLLFLPGILKLSGVSGEIYGEVYDYAVMTVVTGVFTMAMYPAFNFLRLDGKMKAAVAVFFLQGVVTVVADVLLIESGAGITGVGIATLCGTALSGIGGFLIIAVKGKILKPEKVTLKEFIRLSGKIIRTGSPGAVENACIAVRSVVLNNLLMSTFGTYAVTAIGVVNSVNSVALIIISAFSGAVIPFIGVFSADRDTSGIRRILSEALKWGGSLTSVLALFLILFPTAAVLAFGVSEGEAYDVTVTAVRLFSVSLPGSMLGNLLISMHLANKRVWLANIITFLRHFGFLILFFFALVSSEDGKAVWNAYWLTEAATLAVTGIMHLAVSRKKAYVNKLTLFDEETEKAGKSFSYTVQNNVESVIGCVEEVGRFAGENELSPKKSMLLSLSLEEMLSSVREHALKGKSGLTIEVRIVIINDDLIIRIRNGGAQFNPISYYEKMSRSAEGGGIDDMLALEDSLGIKMILDATRVVDYRRTFGVNNLTVVV